MDEKMIQDIGIVEAVIYNFCGYKEKNAWRRIKSSIAENTELEAELVHYKDAFKVVEAEMLERVPKYKIKALIEDIRSEINRRPHAPNIGKKGCVGRLELLFTETGH
jgi:hypothetical protein